MTYKKSNINLILVGGGGFSLEIYSYICDEQEGNNSSNIFIKGVLDSSQDCELCIKNPEVKYLGDIPEYNIEENDFGIIAVGNAASRRDICSLLLSISLPLYTYIHSTAHISLNANIGNGVFIGPHAFVGSHATIADNVVMNIFCGVGHGAKIGKHSVMSPYSAINGDCDLGEAVFLGSGVIANPKTKIGDFSLIDAGSTVRENISPLSIVSQRVEQKIYDNTILRKKLTISNKINKLE